MLMPGFIIAIALGFMVWMYFTKVESNKSINQSIKNELQMPNDTIKKTFSKQEIIKMLDELSIQDVPSHLKPGAMCYAPRRISNTAEYLCPLCGEKSLYNGSFVNIIDYDLRKCRSYMSLLPKEQFCFDESSFCKKCNPNTTEHELCLIVNYQNNQNEKICPVTSDDIKIIGEFLNGKIVHITSNDAELPIKNYSQRLEILFGLKK